MKKLLGLILVSVLTLTACGGEPELTFIGEVTDENSGDITSVTYLKTGDDITSVDFSVIQGSNGIAKEEDPEYVLANPSAGDYATQQKNIENAVVENDAFPAVETIDDKVVAVDSATGATISLSGYQAAFDAAVEQK